MSTNKCLLDTWFPLIYTNKSIRDTLQIYRSHYLKMSSLEDSQIYTKFSLIDPITVVNTLPSTLGTRSRVNIHIHYSILV